MKIEKTKSSEIIFQGKLLDVRIDKVVLPNGDIVILNWDIPAGNNYILTTNMQMNNDNFGDNNPMFKRTTDDLPNFPVGQGVCWAAPVLAKNPSLVLSQDTWPGSF